MTIEDTARILAIIKEAYPNSFKDKQDKEAIKATIRAWYGFIGDLDADLALAAIQAHISTSPYIPTPADIRRRAYQATHPGELSADEAWGMTLKAIQRYGHYGKSEGLTSLPPKVRKIADMMGWDALCMAETDKIGVERGQFIKLYNAYQERDKEQNMLPESLRKKIGQIGLLPR